MNLQINIEFNINDKQWQPILDEHEDDLTLMVEKVILPHHNYRNLSQIELSVLLTDEAESKKLNSQFRSQDKPTNILSFPEKEILPSEVLATKVAGDYMYLGDMALCYEIIRREAVEKGISFRDHLFHLFVHGLLHLIGYNHTQDKEAAAMESVEIGILFQFGIKSPYE